MPLSLLYQVEHKKFTPKHRAVPFTTFNPRNHCLPDVFWFQPYSKDTSDISHSIVLDIKIEYEEFDSTIIPIPNPSSTLVNENSQYLTGCAPINAVLPHLFPNNHGPIRVRTRQTHTENPPIGFIRRDCSRNVLATFCNSGVNAQINGTFSYTRELIHNHLATGSTYRTWRSNEHCPYSDRTLHLWSS